MSNCNDLNIIDLFLEETPESVKEELNDHIDTCSDCKKIYNEYADLFNDLQNININIPSQANDEYFSLLEAKIHSKVVDVCKDVENLLVDYCEGALDTPELFEQKQLVENHIEMCRSCSQEFFLTKKVMEIGDKEKKLSEDYYNTLADKITEKVFGNIESICERAQEFIANKYSDDEIPKIYKNHLDTCKTCQNEVKLTDEMFSNLKSMQVLLPDESYFNSLSYKIENAINLIPGAKPVKEKTTITDKIKTFLSFILRPQIAVTSTAVVSLLVFAVLTFTQNRDANTPFNISKIVNEKMHSDGDVDDIKDIKAEDETALNNKLFFKKEINTPEKDAKLDQDVMQTAAKKKDKE